MDPIIGMPIFLVNSHTDETCWQSRGMDIGSRLRQRRKERRLTQTALAKLVGVKQSSISELETGASAIPKGTTLAELAKALEVSPRWLLTGKGAKEVQSIGNEKEEEAVALLRRLTPEQQDLWLAIGRTIDQDALPLIQPTTARDSKPKLSA